jgi:uncharacterized lipoprotein YajG
MDVDKAIALIKEAQAQNARLQKMFTTGTQWWHALETINDKLHEALNELGH